MDTLTDLEKLAGLKKKGVITPIEFEEQKKALLAANLQNKQADYQKSGAVYLVLAFFLGTLGIHNFYIGRWVRGVIQLILTILSPFTLFVSLIVVMIWVLVEMIVIRTDGTGQPLTPAPVLRGILSALIIIFLLLPVIGILFVGGMAGYSAAMKKYQVNETLDYMTMCAVAAQTSFADGRVNSVICSDLINEDVPDALVQDFYFVDQGMGLATVMTFKEEQTAALVREQSTDEVSLSGNDNRVYVLIPY